MPSYDVVVYGENPWAVCAAVALKKVAEAARVALVVDRPDVLADDAEAAGLSGRQRLGGIYSLGGEVQWDDYGVAGGTYRNEIFARTGRRYAPDRLSHTLQGLCADSDTDVYYGYHLSDLFTEPTYSGSPSVSRITIRPIAYDSHRYYIWDAGRPEIKLEASLFIDASIDARLIRAAAPESLTTGRFDWPAERLTAAESAAGYCQSATIGLCLANFETGGEPSGEWRRPMLDENNPIFSYNLELLRQTHGRFFEGPGDWEAVGEKTIWTTGTHVCKVDTRAFEKDRGTDFFPSDAPADALTYDHGYVALRSEIESGRWIRAISEGLGMPDLKLRAVASTMYVREGCHSMLDPKKRGHGTEETNYAVSTKDAILAGRAGQEGQDGRHYWQRIGIAHYGIDLHAYAFGDLHDPHPDRFYWRPEVEQRIRPDLSRYSTEKHGWWNPDHGVWLPFDCIVSRGAANVLLCGYNVSASSLAWGEIREAPNLCTLGDACGVTAGLILDYSDYTGDIADLEGEGRFIKRVQEALRDAVGANLDVKRGRYETHDTAA
ncbi:MAG: FAD-dependent oxidoreductase [Candidatus Aquicultorales bacterium]